MDDQTGLYPRTYRYGWGWGSATCLGALLITGLGVAIAFPHAWGLDEAPLWLCIGLSVFLNSMAAYPLVSVFRSYVRLEADKLEAQFVFRKWIIRRDQILGIRNIKMTLGTTAFNLIFMDTKERSVTLTDFARKDQLFIDWFAEITDLDDAELVEQGQRIIANPAFGADEETRTKTALREENFIGKLNLVGWVVSIWGLVYPRPYIYCLIALVILPVLAVVLMAFKRKRWMLHEDKDDNRLSLNGLALSPAIVLGLRAVLDVDMLDWQWPLAIAIGLSALAYFFIRMIEGVFKPLGFFIYGFVYLGFVWGALILGNWYFDESEAKAYPVTVLDKSSGEHFDDLKVSPWGPRLEPENVAVSKDVYVHFKTGDKVCVYLYPGAFGWRWYYADACPKP